MQDEIFIKGGYDKKCNKTLYISEALVEEIYAIAYDNNISFNKVVVSIIKDHIRQTKKA